MCYCCTSYPQQHYSCPRLKSRGRGSSTMCGRRGASRFRQVGAVIRLSLGRRLVNLSPVAQRTNAFTEVAVFGPSTPGQTRTPNEGNGTPKRNIFFGTLHITSMHCVRISIADRAARCIADRGTAEAAAQQQQQQWWQRRRGYGRKGRAWIHR